MKRLVLFAVVLVLAYALLDAEGMVDELGVLTSTPPAGQRFEVALAGAALYLLSWFGAVVLAPIFLLTAAFTRATEWKRIRRALHNQGSMKEGVGIGRHCSRGVTAERADPSPRTSLTSGTPASDTRSPRCG